MVLMGFLKQSSVRKDMEAFSMAARRAAFAIMYTLNHRKKELPGIGRSSPFFMFHRKTDSSG